MPAKSASQIRKKTVTKKTARKNIAGGIVHKAPADLQKAIGPDREALAAWNDISPIARNEWICWVESARKPETRSRRIERTRSQLIDGDRRPCCWPGCPHR